MSFGGSPFSAMAVDFKPLGNGQRFRLVPPRKVVSFGTIFVALALPIYVRDKCMSTTLPIYWAITFKQ